MPRIRQHLDDFQVEEIPLYQPQGEGQHTFLLIETRDRATDVVARDLARLAGVPLRDVGFAGRKDRRSVSRQWFSVPGLDPATARSWSLPGSQVLDAVRHRHKLRTGQLSGNRFEIIIREVGREQAEAAVNILSRFSERGFPNRFGSQRFGNQGRNVESGVAVLRSECRLGDRRHARFLVSAVQAAVFNTVLARRPLALHQVARGDVAVVHTSGGLFLVEDLRQAEPRAARFEISATGPIFGTKMLSPGGEILALEASAMAELGLPHSGLRAPPGIRIPGGRRPVRARPEAASCRFAAEALHLRFTLPKGCYATVLLEELFPGQSMVEGPPETEKRTSLRCRKEVLTLEPSRSEARAGTNGPDLAHE